LEQSNSFKYSYSSSTAIWDFFSITELLDVYTSASLTGAESSCSFMIKKQFKINYVIMFVNLREKPMLRVDF